MTRGEDRLIAVLRGKTAASILQLDDDGVPMTQVSPAPAVSERRVYADARVRTMLLHDGGPDLPAREADWMTIDVAPVDYCKSLMRDGWVLTEDFSRGELLSFAEEQRAIVDTLGTEYGESDGDA